ncbi:MAG: hypothetical protein P0Y65_16240 [Candidatus Devosia phytovorans]|uniref:Cellulose-binding protein n=1 Tax=Candidatus Devosia phytovorans TaxID=3121372 RepID=A0AAJ6AZ46_9HYPH|nr:hypothetical protein [Devosia sp.]WEK03727.1 MAG: hypothetical protein P0Y65_16240 [Devosia sp.]
MLKLAAPVCLSTWLLLITAIATPAQEAAPLASPQSACGIESILAYQAEHRIEGVASRAAPGDELVDPSVGMGLAGIEDWTSEQPFIDVAKTARPWTGHLPGQWGGWSHEDLETHGYLDENGWPTSIPPELTSVDLLMLSGLPTEATSINGRYRLTFEGEGRIEVSSMLKYWETTGGELWFEASTGNTIVSIKIFETDPNKTGNYIRNISVVKEENVAAFDAGEIFNPLWIKHVRDARLVRFMDWMQTNHSKQSEWADRPLPGDYTYALRGAPLEIMVELANEIGADPWFNMPHLATDEYLTCFAEAVHATLRPELKAHVEFSNEVWNWMFDQAQWADEQAIARWGQKDRWLQYYSVRAMDMARAWRAVYGADADQRLDMVLATFTGWQGIEADIVAPTQWIAENPAENKSAADYFDSYAVTGYFGYSLGDAKADLVREWIADSIEAAATESKAQGLSGTAATAFVAEHRFDQAIALAAEELRDGSITGDTSSTIAEYLENTLPYQAKIASDNGLDLIMYEGGTHVVGIGLNQEDEALAEFYVTLNYSSEMAGLYRELMSGWREAGGTVFTIYADVASASKFGSWGALRHLNDDNPRWDAIVEFNQANPGWWEERSETSFIGQ